MKFKIASPIYWLFFLKTSWFSLQLAFVFMNKTICQPPFVGLQKSPGRKGIHSETATYSGQVSWVNSRLSQASDSK